MSVLISGTAIGQIITVLSSPILTRLYTPEEIGVLGLFTSVVAILTVVMTLGYEMAIVLPKSDKESFNILALSINTSLFLTIFFLLFNALLGKHLSNLLDSPDLTRWLWFAPISALFIGIYNSFNYWSVRKKYFKRISTSRVLRSTGMVSVQLGSGVAGAGVGGLIGGQIFGQILATYNLAHTVWKDNKKDLRSNLNVKSMRELSKRYATFPLFSMPQSLVNSISQNAAPFLLGIFFGPSVVGFYAMALRSIQLPANLIGDAFRQVYFQRISELINSNKKISKYLIKTTFYLILVGLLPVLFFFLFAPSIFKLIFGSEWYVAGQYSRWLVVWLFFWFINRPTISTIQTLGLQKYLLIFEVVLFIARTAGLFISAKYWNALAGVISYSLIGALFTPLVTISTIIFVIRKEKN